MVSLFRMFFGGGDAVATQPPGSDFNEAISGLDIDLARAAHENWKLRLQAYLAGHSREDFSPDTICLDNRCDLGQWIHGPGQARLGRYPGFTALVRQHRMFHYTASNVVALQLAGQVAEAQQMLDHHFQDYSHQVVQSLNQLQQIALSAPKRRA